MIVEIQALSLTAHRDIVVLAWPSATWKFPISPRGRKCLASSTWTASAAYIPTPSYLSPAFAVRTSRDIVRHRISHSIPLLIPHRHRPLRSQSYRILNSQLPLGHKHKKWTTGDTIIASNFVEIHHSTSRLDLLGRSSLRYAMTFHGRW